MAASTEKISASPPASSVATLITAEIPESPLSAIGIDGGDWICGDGDCKNVNFGRRTQCNKCHREKSPERVVSGTVKKKLGTEIGKAAAEKSRGLFSAEDWQCSKCANVNWARRQTCNMCNAPKFCDVEERTGYGGGYNDRGIVEYKDRSESDSEYDEFGRRKKKLQKMSTASGAHGDDDEYTEDDKNEEDDDDDEDDGDGDLSKYDLWGDDEVVAASNKALNKGNSHSAQSPKSSVKRSSSSTSTSGSKSATRSRSKSSTSSYSSSSTASESHKPKKRRTSSRSRNRSRDRSKTHSTTSSRKSNRKRSRSGSHSMSPSRVHRSRDYKMHSSRHGNSHSSSSSSRGRPERDIKKRVPPRSRTRSRSPRSRSSSRNRRDISKASKYKSNNSSHSPKSSSQTASSRYRRRSRSKSLSIEQKRH